MRKKSGQVLILVLLIVVVSLSVGLSIASRNITNLRTSTQTEQSQRAFSAAEGGIEDVLSGGQTRINDLLATPGVDKVTVGNIETQVDVTSKSSLEDIVSEGNVAQIDLQGATGSEILIEWAKAADASNFASVEITQVNGSAGTYSQSRWAYSGGSHGADEQGFSSPNSGCTTVDFVYCAKIPLAANPILLRVKPFWNSTELRVSSVGAGTLPPQQYDVSSTAATELGIVRKVQVTKTKLPQLPASFDYVLYSEGAIVK